MPNLIYEIESKTKFRAMPLLGPQSYADHAVSDKEKESNCRRKTGHILSVHGDEIVCTACPARWKNEGF